MCVRPFYAAHNIWPLAQMGFAEQAPNRDAASTCLCNTEVGDSKALHAVVVDELHSFAGDDRGWHLLFLMSRLEQLCERRFQRVGLTATVGNPAEVLEWFTSGRGGQSRRTPPARGRRRSNR